MTSKQQQIVDYLSEHPVLGPYVRSSFEFDPPVWPYWVPRVLPSVGPERAVPGLRSCPG